MDNKKLLKIILKDLSELEELIAETGRNNFDELEWEFLQTRVSGAKRMIDILFDRETSDKVEAVEEEEFDVVEEEEFVPIPKNEDFIAEEKVEQKLEEELPIDNKEVKVDIPEPAPIKETTQEVEVIAEEQSDVSNEKETVVSASVSAEELELDEEEIVAEKRQTLGDRFLKEKSVNDLVDADKKNLEQKLSNRPVTSIKSAIGINDRFQFIRELFNGDSEMFSKTVSELDNKKEIGEAVEYLQQNFKWKKNETSLKFVNLVKRRFSND